MAQAPAKKNPKEERDNIFLAILYTILIQLPSVAIAWIVSQFMDD